MTYSLATSEDTLAEAHSGVEERYLGRLKRAHRAEMLYGILIKFGETFAHDAWQYRAKLYESREGVETRW